MNQAPCNPYFLNLKPEGLLVVHSTFEEQPPTNRVVAIPFTRIARQKKGAKSSWPKWFPWVRGTFVVGSLIEKPGSGPVSKGTHEDRSHEP